VQISGRLLRHGQKRSVTIVRYYTLGSPDEMYEDLVDGRLVSLASLFASIGLPTPNDDPSIYATAFPW
jgi:hypothetical protein